MTPESLKRDMRRAIQIADALLETVKEAGDHGAPLGPMYAACMGVMDYETFMQIIDLLQKAGRIRVVHHCAFYNREAGR